MQNIPDIWTDGDEVSVDGTTGGVAIGDCGSGPTPLGVDGFGVRERRIEVAKSLTLW
jgi:hypothetical protein